MTIAPMLAMVRCLAEGHPGATERTRMARRLSGGHPRVTERASGMLEGWIPTDLLAVLSGRAETDRHARGYEATQNPLGSHANWKGTEGKAR